MKDTEAASATAAAPVAPSSGSRPRHNRLRSQLADEVQAMASHALATGMTVPPRVLRVALQVDGTDLAVLNPAQLSELMAAHETLRQLVAPATPRTLALIAADAARERRFDWLPSLGPVRLVRSLTATGLLFLVALIVLGLSEDVSRDSGGILEDSGWTLLQNLLFMLCAAGLGAVFAALFSVGRYLADGTYDPNYESSYWINIVLGLIAGLLLAELIPETFDLHSVEGSEAAEFNFARPVLALVGGFSATVVFRILRKLVEAVESVFRGNVQETVAAQTEVARYRLAAQQTEDRIRLSTRLAQLQQSLTAGATNDEIAATVDELLEQVLPTGLGATPLEARAPDSSSPAGGTDAADTATATSGDEESEPVPDDTTAAESPPMAPSG